MSEMKWKWFGNAGHLIVGSDCRFHLCTQVAGYLISTVGEYWPERAVRDIHAKVNDPSWFRQHGALLGDSFDAKYRERFGYAEIGCSRLFETMVFKAGTPCSEESCGGCGMPRPDDWGELDFNAYNTAADATRGHLAMCEKYAALSKAGRP